MSLITTAPQSVVPEAEGPQAPPGGPGPDGGGKRRPRLRIPTTRSFIAIYIAAGAVLVAAVAGFLVFDKTYTLRVDGQTRTVRSFSGDVASVLTAAHIKVGRHDLVMPATSASVGTNTPIVVRHARPLTMTIDGKTRTAWTTGLTVGQALDDLRVDDDGAAVSAKASQPIPSSGYHVTIRMPKRYVVLLDQVRLVTETAATTVHGVLADAGIKLGKHDKVSPKPATKVHGGTVIRVRRLMTKPKIKLVRVKAPVRHVKDPHLTVGQTKVTRKGRDGIKQVMTAYVKHRGHPKRVVIAQAWKRHPKTELVAVGTKPAPHNPSVGGNVGGSVDSLNWPALAKCESGGNPKAVNGAGYYGLYQFSAATWHTVGGTGLPTDASAAEQTYRAKLLYKKVDGRWQGQWPVCGKNLFT